MRQNHELKSSALDSLEGNWGIVADYSWHYCSL